jgi:hypothetical protein
MNVKKKGLKSLIKSLFLFPLPGLLVFLFNASVAIGQRASSLQYINVPKDGMETEGEWSAAIKDNYVNITFRKEGDLLSYSSIMVPLSELKGLPKEAPGTFALSREAGTMNFSGKFEKETGKGRYRFTPDKDYGDYMRAENISITGEGCQMGFFLVDISRSYIQMLKNSGYSVSGRNDLIALAALDVNEEYIRSIKAAGVSNISLGEFIPFRALKIDKDYILALRNAGYSGLSAQKIITLKISGITK